MRAEWKCEALDDGFVIITQSMYSREKKVAEKGALDVLQNLLRWLRLNYDYQVVKMEKDDESHN